MLLVHVVVVVLVVVVVVAVPVTIAAANVCLRNQMESKFIRQNRGRS